jgi:membrane protein YqaA with SNARE-associated domain
LTQPEGTTILKHLLMINVLATGFLAHWISLLQNWLLRLGIWGIGVAAIIDTSSIPLPMDLLIGGYVWADRPHFWIYCLLASVGSSIGGLVPFLLGRAGGELFLLKRMDRAKLEELRDRFARQEFLAVLVPSMLPPPTPWKIFVFGAGVFEMKILPFMLAVFVGRMIRWMLLSLLVIWLGPSAVEMVAHHALKAFLVLLAVAVIGLIIWLWRRKKSGDA